MAQSDGTNESREALERESLSWVNRLLSGAVTPSQAQAFKIWRETSPGHAQAFADAVRFRRGVKRAVLEGRLRGKAPPGAGETRRLASRRSTRRALLGGAFAASAAYMVVRPPDHLWSSWSELTSDYRTAPGERLEVAVAHGVSLDLNTRTSIARRTVAGAAGIELVSGEAVVTARRPPTRAFAIAAGVGRATMTQAVADIRGDAGDVCVTCLAGDLDVIHPHGTIELTAGQQVRYTDHRLDERVDVDSDLVSAWRQGLLIFRNAPLQQVVDELNRYRSGRIILTRPALARRPVYGVFQIREIARAVRQVQDLTGARVTNLPGGITLLT